MNRVLPDHPGDAARACYCSARRGLGRAIGPVLGGRDRRLQLRAGSTPIRYPPLNRVRCRISRAPVAVVLDPGQSSPAPRANRSSRSAVSAPHGVDSYSSPAARSRRVNRALPDQPNDATRLLLLCWAGCLAGQSNPASVVATHGFSPARGRVVFVIRRSIGRAAGSAGRCAAPVAVVQSSPAARAIRWSRASASAQHGDDS